MKSTERHFFSVLLVGWLAISPMALSGQTFSEFFRQKKTQRKYLRQQIAALQVYIGYAQKGYSIAKEGLDMIGGLKNGELDLHSGHFLSLQKVDRNIREHIPIAGLIASQARMEKDTEGKIDDLSGGLTQGELEYIERVANNILAAAKDILDQIITLCTDGYLQMTDDARLSRIDALYVRFRDHHGLLQKFRNGAVSLALGRLREESATGKARLLYGLQE